MNAEKLIANSLGTVIAVVAMGASAQLSISLPESTSVAPITGQSLAVLLVAWLLRWQWGTLAVILYLLVGVLGAPVYSDFSSGIETFTGPSLGYFIGFIVATAVVGKMAETQKSRFGYYLLQMLIGSLIILLIGWLGLFRYLDAKDGFMKGVLPFLPGALVKIFLAAILLSVYRRFKQLLNMGKS